MLTVPLLTTVTVGNHLLTAAEQAAGVPQRPPFVDEDGNPVDPDAVRIWLTDPDKVIRSFRYPAPGPDDVGACERQEVGRFFVQWTPTDPGDGLWQWKLEGGMTLGSGWSDKGVFCVQRDDPPGP
jgi:hypothetical protein